MNGHEIKKWLPWVPTLVSAVALVICLTASVRVSAQLANLETAENLEISEYMKSAAASYQTAHSNLVMWNGTTDKELLKLYVGANYNTLNNFAAVASAIAPRLDGRNDSIAFAPTLLGDLSMVGAYVTDEPGSLPEYSDDEVHQLKDYMRMAGIQSFEVMPSGAILIEFLNSEDILYGVIYSPLERIETGLGDCKLLGDTENGFWYGIEAAI